MFASSRGQPHWLLFMNQQLCYSRQNIIISFSPLIFYNIVLWDSNINVNAYFSLSKQINLITSDKINDNKLKTLINIFDSKNIFN